MVATLFSENRAVLEFAGDWVGGVFKGKLTSRINKEFRGLFANFENAVNQQLLLKVDELDKQIDAISWRVRIESKELTPSNLQVFPSEKSISFEVRESND